jgi:phage gp46-like protein
MISQTRMITLFEGDPKLFLDESGSYLRWVGGQCIMDAGLENAVFISLFTTLEPKNSPRGWAGNYLFENNEVWVGSRFEEAINEPITLSTLTNAEDEAKKALDWMIAKNLASSIDVTITNPVGPRIETLIQIKPPDLPIQQLLLIKNGVNWIYQIEDPAHRRFADGV